MAGRVGEDLHLDVPGTHDGLLEEDACVAEGGAGLAHRLGDRRRQLCGRLDAPHAAAAAAGDGLDEDREADVGRLRDELVDVVGRLASSAAPGTPAAIACCLAVTLLPAISSAVEGGPMKVMPFSAARAASSGFSERNP